LTCVRWRAHPDGSAVNRGRNLVLRLHLRAGGHAHQPANTSQTEPLIAIVARTDPNEQESVLLLPDPKDN
jgi:hypothetical protein